MILQLRLSGSLFFPSREAGEKSGSSPKEGKKRDPGEEAGVKK